jgi:anhydro-N-acetylmuramic acid kinase
MAVALNRDSQIFIGLMSGTSLDGIDAALVHISESVDGPEATTRATHFRPYADEERNFLQSLQTDASLKSVCETNSLLALLHAEAVLSLLHKANIKSDKVAAIGFHGQTVHHQPDKTNTCGYSTRGTLQLGDPALLATRTGIPVISQFRLQDMALGGQGAPLVPGFDYSLMKSDQENRVLANIGGIANLTFLPAGCKEADVIAFDSGPGNTLIDAGMSIISRGQKHFDNNGETAAKGSVNQHQIEKMLEDSFYSKKPPKSTGKEYFNSAYIENAGIAKIPAQDCIATLTNLTAATIINAIADFWPRAVSPDRLIVSGGGVLNQTLMDMLKQASPGFKVVTSSHLGIDPIFKEAIAFAYLAWCFINNRPGTLASATGASEATISGSYTPPAGSD